MPGIVVVGSINADLVAQVTRHPKPGETVLGTGGHVTAGGKGANQAVAAALQGVPVHFVGAIGDDAYAAPATQFLSKSGVDLTAVTTVSEPTGLAIITVAADGENSIVVIPGANTTVDDTYVAAHAATLAAADILVLQGEIPESGIATAMRIAQENQVRIVLNLAPVIPLPAALLRLADPLIANEHEAALLLELFGHTEIPDTPEALLAALAQEGCPSIILTLGAAGALVHQEGTTTAIPAHKVTAVDTTGAGDAFVGGVAAQLCSGATLEDAARFATAVSAVAVQELGAQSSYRTITS